LAEIACPIIDFPDIKNYNLTGTLKVSEIIFCFIKNFYEKIILADMKHLVSREVQQTALSRRCIYLNTKLGTSVEFSHIPFNHDIILCPSIYTYPRMINNHPSHRYIEFDYRKERFCVETSSFYEKSKFCLLAPYISSPIMDGPTRKYTLEYFIAYRNRNKSNEWRRRNAWEINDLLMLLGIIRHAIAIDAGPVCNMDEALKSSPANV